MKKNIYEVLAWIWFGLGLIIGVAYIVVLNSQISFSSNVDIAKAGAIGDLIGGVVGSLWALAGVFLFFQALKLQRHDLEAQIEENQETRKVLIAQNENLAIQKFETTFFNMLEVHDRIRNSISAKISRVTGFSNDSVIQDATFFEAVTGELMKRLTLEHHRNPEIVDSKAAAQEYHYYYLKIEPFVGHYFRHLHHLLKFVHVTGERKIEGFNPKTYTDIIQSQMSSGELLLVYYNALCFPQMNEFIEQYQFLRNLPLDHLPVSTHNEFYKSFSLKKIEDQMSII